MDNLEDNHVFKEMIKHNQLPKEYLKKVNGHNRDIIIELFKQAHSCNNAIYLNNGHLWEGTQKDSSLYFFKEGVVKTSYDNRHTVGIYRIDGNKIHLKHVKTNGDVEVIEETLDINPYKAKEISIGDKIFRPNYESYFPQIRPYDPSPKWHPGDPDPKTNKQWTSLYDKQHQGKLNALGKLMSNSREPTEKPFSNRDQELNIVQLVHDSFTIKDENSLDKFLERIRICYTFFPLGTCWYESSEEKDQNPRWGNYLIINGNELQVNLILSEDFNKVNGEENILSNTFKFDSLREELIDINNRVFKKPEGLTETEKNSIGVIAPYFEVKALNQCTVSGLKSLFVMAKSTNISRKYSYEREENWDVCTKEVSFSPNGIVYLYNYFGNHDYSSDKKQLGIYLIRPNNKVLILTFKEKSDNSISQLKEPNQILPDIEEHDWNLEEDQIIWSGITLKLK